MIGKVWIVARHRRGRKKHFALRWNEPVLDSRGQPVLDREGKVQYRTVTEACKDENQRDRTAVDAAIAACFNSEDYREGRIAFMEKRSPRFRGC